MLLRFLISIIRVCVKILNKILENYFYITFVLLYVHLIIIKF